MIVYAVNVHTGGGKVLIDELIEGHPWGSVSYLFVDSRYNGDKARQLGIQVTAVSPNPIARLKAEFLLQNIAACNPSETILFFGNLPPFKRLKNKSILFLQNCFLLHPVPLPKDSLKVIIRTLFERFWINLFIKSVDEVWVQTNWMFQLFKSQFPMIPLFLKPLQLRLQMISEQKRDIDVISVTSFSRHKNLNVLIDALEILDRSLKSRIIVVIVLDSKDSYEKLEEKHYLNIELSIKNSISREELGHLYARSKLSVITSSFESYCLPLFHTVMVN